MFSILFGFGASTVRGQVSQNTVEHGRYLSRPVPATLDVYGYSRFPERKEDAWGARNAIGPPLQDAHHVIGLFSTLSGRRIEDQTSRGLTLEMRGRFRLAPKLELSTQWAAIRSQVQDGERESGFMTSNPYVSLSARIQDRFSVQRFGAGVSVPLATKSQSTPLDADSAALDLAIGSAAFREFHLWIRDTYSLTGHYETLRRVGNAVTVSRVELILQLYSEDTFVEGHRGDLALSAVTGIGGAFGQGSHAGVRFSAYWIPTLENALGRDLFQLGLEPYIEIAIGSLSLVSQLTLNLDPPYGWSFSDGGVWGLDVGALFRL
ncbi:MAG: hypothetical protein AAF355_05370 [Myxococcota bacterium]